MSKRRGSLFPRALGDVVKTATQPLMDAQGKLYGALLRDWAVIVGAERAKNTRPQCLKWHNAKAEGAVLHLDVSRAVAPELAYETEQMLEQCARYFGYRAITRIVIHPSHAFTTQPVVAAKPKPEASAGEATPNTMMDILQRMRQRIAEDDKRDESR